MLDLDVPDWDFVPDPVAKARPHPVKKLQPKAKPQKQTEPQNAQPAVSKKTGKNPTLQATQPDTKPKQKKKEEQAAQPMTGKKAAGNPPQAQHGKQQKKEPQPMEGKKGGKTPGLKKAQADAKQQKTGAGGNKEAAAGAKRSLAESQSTDAGGRPKETLKEKKRRLRQLREEQGTAAVGKVEASQPKLPQKTAQKPSQKPTPPPAPQAVAEPESVAGGKKKKKKKNKNKFKPQEEATAEQPQVGSCVLSARSTHTHKPPALTTDQEQSGSDVA